MLLPPTDRERLTDDALVRARADLVREGVYAQVSGALTGGVLAVGYGLALGASNFVIGLLAAVPFFAQLLQVPAIALVERLRARRAIAITSVTVSRALLIPIACLPFVPDSTLALGLLVAGTAASAGLGAMAGCAWNSWIHDLVPREGLGAFFAQRQFHATAWAMLAGLLAGAFVGEWTQWMPDRPLLAYTVLGLLGAVAGAASTFHLARVAEPRMSDPERRIRIVKTLTEPFRDSNFRRLMWFLGAWQFATNLAAPFFAVYLLRQLDYSLGFVTLMTVTSQLAYVLVLRSWGSMTDRFSNKAVLRVCGPLFLLCIFAWTLVALPEKHAFTGLFLAVLHAVMGFAAAGVNLASGNIGLKLAPVGRGTAYLAASSIVNSLAAGVAPILGGLFADDLATRELSLVLRWTHGPAAADFTTLRLRHWDFFFALACLVGLYALHRLTLVNEEGPPADRSMMTEVMDEAWRAVLSVSSIAGLRLMTAFPFGRLVRAARAKRMRPRSTEPPVPEPEAQGHPHASGRG